MSILEKLVNSGANVIATGTNEEKLKSITSKFAKVLQNLIFQIIKK